MSPSDRLDVVLYAVIKWRNGFVASSQARLSEVSTLAPISLRLGRIAVECWIGVVTEGERRIVRVAGRLSVAHVAGVLTACADSAVLEIDLTDLVSADVAGIEALQRVRAQGATLVGTPGTSS